MRISDMFAALDQNEMDYICELCAADADEDKENHKRQYSQTMKKIYSDIEMIASGEAGSRIKCENESRNENIPKGFEPAKALPSGRKRPGMWRIAAAAAALLILLTASLAYADQLRDFDIRLEEFLGMDGVMETLPGGYVKLDVGAASGGHRICAYESLGDRNSQWIWLKTDIPWELPEDEETGAYYLFDTMSFSASDPSETRGNPWLDGGGFMYCFNDEGYVGLMYCMGGYEGINRAEIHVTLKDLYAYDHKDASYEERRLQTAGEWNLTWENHYAANIRTSHPVQWVAGSAEDPEYGAVLLTSVELSPVSLRLNAVKNPLQWRNSTGAGSLRIESIILKDGTEISLEDGLQNTVNGDSNFQADAYLAFGGPVLKQLPAVSEISALVVNGVRVNL